MSIPHFVLLSLLLLVKNSLTALAISKQPVAINKGYASMQVHTLANPVASTAPSSVTAAIASTGLLSLSLLPNSVTSMPSHTNLRRRQLLEQEPIYTQRAWLYSTVLPGLGQAYNKSYWKIPAIYGVFAGLAWGATYNHLE